MLHHRINLSMRLGRSVRPVGRLVRHVAPRLATRAASAQPLAAPPSTSSPSDGFFYDGVVFDMDGTLTEGHIDFADMRQRTDIPQGDLFTVLETSTPEHIAKAMAVILEIEAEAALKVSMKPGLMPLLAMLREKKVRVSLVTRNTHASVDAFLRLIGPEWSSLFDPVLTREFPFVKPDKRLLLHVAQAWGVDPARLLMVGDSFEDVEVGNAAGTATCLVAGGGNEKPGAVVSTPAGALATFTVSGLDQLQQMLEGGGGGEGGASSSSQQQQQQQQGRQLLQLGWPARLAAGETPAAEGSPAPGLDFLDWCISQGAMSSGEASYPRMGCYAGGLATCPVPGSKVLHVGCGPGGLTKTMCSQGMQVLGTDPDIEAALRRGLAAVPMFGSELVTGSLRVARKQGPFDVVLLQGTSLDLVDQPGMRRWWQPEPLIELLSVLEVGSSGGMLCADVMLEEGVTNPAAILDSLTSNGVEVVAWQLVDVVMGRQGRVLRLAGKRSS